MKIWMFFLSAGLILTGCSVVSSPSSPVDLELTARRDPTPTLLAEPGVRIELPQPMVEITQTAPSQAEFPPEIPQAAVIPPTPLPAAPLPAAPRLRQLTQGGCCVNPFWSADSQQVLFIDRPSPDSPAGIWGIGLEGGDPVFVSDRLGLYSEDQTLRAFPLPGQTIVERLSDGQQWAIPSEGRAVVFSSDGSKLAWTLGGTQQPFDSAQRQVWISNVDGSAAQLILTGLSAGISGWFPDGRLLVNGRLDPPELGQALWALEPPTTGEGQWIPRELVRADRVRGPILSPDGIWLAYVSAFSPDPAQNGLWLLDTRSMERLKLDVFGAYRWRDSNRLLVIPLDLAQPLHQILQVVPTSGAIVTLTTPETVPFKISNGDWSVSPDGQHIVFVSAQDGNLWLISFNQN
jgi:Tol biopolymer transport system component